MSSPSDTRFDSWKEIAAYLDRDIRTVRRWEKERGLPVHRIPGDGRRAIYAFRSELDSWLLAERESQSAARDLATVKPTASAPTPPSEGELAASQRNDRLGFGFAKAARAILVLAAGIGAIMLTVSVTRALHGAVIGRISFSGTQLLAWTGEKVAWSYDFGQPLRNVRQEEVPFKLQIQDLGQHGHREIEVAAPLLVFEKGDLSTDALYSFASQGKLLWQHLFTDRIRFGGEDCGPRWEISHLMTTGSSSTRSLWCPINSFPTSVSVLMKIDDQGHVSQHFVNYGHLRALNEIRTANGTFLLVGGINNETDEGALAVLKESETGGRSPQTGALAQCEGCPPGQPYRYVLFPRSEVNRLIGPAYNNVFEILVTGDRIQVMTTEARGENSPPADWAMYEISDDFTPRSVSFSDNYWLDHQRLSAEGKINHKVENCPERLKPIAVREWSSERGWTRVSLPPIAGRQR